MSRQQVPLKMMATSSVDSAKIVDGTIATIDFGDLQVTSGKLAAGSAATNVGTLGGGLGGTLPNPTLAAGAAAANVGTLGGSLSGTLPNPALAANAVGTTQLVDGSVTSAKIADGTIATADVAINAIQEFLGGYSANPSFSTTAVSSWVATPVTFTTASIPAGSFLRVQFTYTMLHTVVAAGWNIGVSFNGAAPTNNLAFHNQFVAGYAIPGSLVTYFTTVSTGVQTITLSVFNVTAGTLQLHGSVTHQMFINWQKR